MPETNIDKNYPKPRLAPVGEVEMVEMEFTDLSTLGFR